MTKSTPSDLAVAFRSASRRQREAIGEADVSTVEDTIDQLHHHVEAAAALLGAPADASAVADAIDNRPLDSWDEDTLDALRQHALDIGEVFRRLSAMTGAYDPDE